MASTTLVRDFIWQLCSALNDNNPQYEVWLESEIVLCINDGQLGIMKYLPNSCSRTDAMRLKQSSLQSIANIPAADLVPADGSSPPAAGVIGMLLLEVPCNMGASGSGEGRSIRISKRQEWDHQNPDWRSVTGTVVREFSYDENLPQQFEIRPVPTTNAQWARISYVAYPTKLPPGNDTTPVYLVTGGNLQTLSIDDANVDDLLWYCLARLNLKDVPQAKAEVMRQSSAAFLSSINAQVKAWTGKDPNIRALPFMPPSAAQGS